jgi:nucleotide-binding universal stress UspA family protein
MVEDIESSSMKDILVATDGTDHSNVAIAFASEMAKMTGANLTVALVNVARGGLRAPLLSSLDDAEATRIVDEAAAKARKAGATKVAQGILLNREAAAAIVRYAEGKGVDYIVTGTGDKHGVSRLMLGSVAADVASRAHCGVTIAC